MSLRYGAGTPRPLPRVLRRRAIEEARVDAFLAVIRRSAHCTPACDHVPAPRTTHDDTVTIPAIILTASAPLR